MFLAKPLSDMKTIDRHTAGALLILQGALALYLCILIESCASQDNPEAEIRAFIDKAEKAVEENNLHTVRSLIADDYSAANGKTKQDLVSMVAYHVLRQQSIHLLTHTRDIQFSTPDRATVELLVAMSGQPVENRSMLLNVQADIYRFTFIMHKQGSDWLLSTAAWQQATMDDIFLE